MRHLLYATSTLLLAFNATAGAGHPTKAEIVGSAATWEGSWDWANDDGLAANHSKLTVISETEFVYVYDGATYEMSGKLGHGGAIKTEPHVVNLTLPHGDELRFVWSSMGEIEGQFWQKGKKHARSGYHTPETTAKLKLVKPKGPPLLPGGGNGVRQPHEIDAGTEVVLEVVFVDWEDHPKGEPSDFDAR